MRRTGLWHPRLAQIVAALGHTQTLVVADAGLPVPSHVETVDLLFTRGEPRLLPVLRALATELVVEQAVLAEELSDEVILRGVESTLPGLPIKRTAHEDFKARCHTARAVVRTGEATPYANVILQAGVPF